MKNILSDFIPIFDHHPGQIQAGPTEVVDALAVILSTFKEAVVVLDTNKQVLIWNRAAENLVGYNWQQTFGKQFNSLLRVYLNNQDVSDQLLSSGNTMDNLKLIGGKGTQQKPLLVRIAVGMAMDPRHHIGWILTIYDVAAEKQTEEMKLGFVSIAAHELRTPLTSLKGYLSVYQDDYGKTLNEDQKTLFAHMSSDVERLLALVENLLNVSRIERGTTVFNPENLDYTKIVKESVDDFSERAAEKHLTLSFVPPSQALPLVKADKVRISEVISNLVSNAINYTAPGGKIQVSVELVPGQVVTHVADNGKGIPPEAIPHLFTKFFRVNQGLTQGQVVAGNGLGLYISKAIVDMHSGKIWVNSEVGKGSVFSFSIPVS